jgi:hypothetical protein
VPDGTVMMTTAVDNAAALGSLGLGMGFDTGLEMGLDMLFVLISNRGVRLTVEISS